MKICDDGLENGTYGHCNGTCSGITGSCGDGMVSGGELCDNGVVGVVGRPVNGEYCGSPSITSCRLEDSCGYDCRSRAPHCGDAAVQAPEQCDGGVETTQKAICRGGENDGRPCDSSADCPGFDRGAAVCGGTPGQFACTGEDAGAGKVCASGTVHPLCSTDRDCTGASAGRCIPRAELPCTPPALPEGASAADAMCGPAGRCLSYGTQHTRACGVVGAPDQCLWSAWSACLPIGRCGDGHVDVGEDCDDGNSNNNDACINTCRVNTCGDGVMYTGIEECDYGSRNGTTSDAEYGSTVISCSMECRQIPSSGGYCGDEVKNGIEQCDGVASVPVGLTCSSLGYDYAANIQCAHPRFTTNADRTIVACTGPTCCCADDRHQGTVTTIRTGGLEATACLATALSDPAIIGCYEYAANINLPSL